MSAWVACCIAGGAIALVVYWLGMADGYDRCMQDLLKRSLRAHGLPPSWSAREYAEWLRSEDKARRN